MATKAHTEVPGGAKPQFPPFNKDTFASQLIWLAVFFVAIYVVVSRLAIPRIGGIFAARAERIAGDLAEAEHLKAQSDAALEAYEKSLAEARERAQAVANQTREKLNGEAEARRKKLEGELNARLSAAESSIAATKTAAMANVRGIAAEAAAAIVQRLIGTQPAPQTVDEAVASVLKG